MRGFRNRVASQAAAMFLALADKMLGGDSKLARLAEQQSWNRDPKTFSKWRIRQQSVAARRPALYLTQADADRAQRRYSRAWKALSNQKRSPVSGHRYLNLAEMPTHIKRNAGVPVLS